MFHKLYLGDSLKIMKKIENNSIHLVITSPPYFNAKDYNLESDNVGNNDSYETYLKRMRILIKELFRTLEPGCVVCFNTSPVIHEKKRYGIPFDTHKIFEEEGFKFEEDIIWKKPDGAARLRCGGWVQNNQTPSTWHPNIVTEYIMVYKKEGERIRSKFKPNLLLHKKDILTNVWTIQPANIKWHDAPYPDELVERLILLYSFENEIILDPFGGTLTNMFVARKHNRNSISIEISEEYLKEAKQMRGWGQQLIGEQITYEEII